MSPLMFHALAKGALAGLRALLDGRRSLRRMNGRRIRRLLYSTLISVLIAILFQLASDLLGA